MPVTGSPDGGRDAGTRVFRRQSTTSEWSIDHSDVLIDHSDVLRRRLNRAPSNTESCIPRAPGRAFEMSRRCFHHASRVVHGARAGTRTSTRQGSRDRKHVHPSPPGRAPLPTGTCPVRRSPVLVRARARAGSTTTAVVIYHAHVLVYSPARAPSSTGSSRQHHSPVHHPPTGACSSDHRRVLLRSRAGGGWITPLERLGRPRAGPRPASNGRRHATSTRPRRVHGHAVRTRRPGRER
jgi:hypothetical protein